MGVNLWGESPLCVNPIGVAMALIQNISRRQGQLREGLSEGSEVAEGESDIASVKPECKAMSRRTETAYKAQSPGKLAQHNKAPGSGDRVNAAVV